MDLGLNVALTGVDAAATGKYREALLSSTSGTAAGSLAAYYLKLNGAGFLARGVGTSLVTIVMSKLVELEYQYLNDNENKILSALVQEPGTAPLTAAQKAQALTAVLRGSVTKTYSDITTILHKNASYLIQGIANTAGEIEAFDQHMLNIANQIEGAAVTELDAAIGKLGSGVNNNEDFESYASGTIGQDVSDVLSFFSQAVTVIGTNSAESANSSAEAEALSQYVNDYSNTLPPDVAFALQSQAQTNNGEPVTFLDGATVTENADGSHVIVLPDPNPGDNISQTIDLFNFNEIPIQEVVYYDNGTIIVHVDDPNNYSGIISNFVPGSTIDLNGIAAIGVGWNGSDAFTVEESSAGPVTLRLDPSQDYSSDNFLIAPDGNGGTNVIAEADDTSLEFTGPNEWLVVQNYESLSAPIANFGIGDTIEFYAGAAYADAPDISINVLSLLSPSGAVLGTLDFDAARNSGSITIPDGLVIELATIPSSIVISYPTVTNESDDKLLSNYLADLGVNLSSEQIDSANFNYLNPTGAAYTLAGSALGTNGDTTATVTYSVLPTTSPGAVIAGQSNATITYGVFNQYSKSVPVTENVLDAYGDISQDTVTSIQTLSASQSLALTSAQFNSFSTIAGGGDLTITTGGTASLASSKVTGTFEKLAADGWDGATLIGNNQNAQILQASLLGNDTLEAGGGTGDQLIAGEGVDTLVGGNGGDTFIADSGLAVGSILTGNGAGNVLEAQGDISAGTVVGIQTLDPLDVFGAGPITLSAQEFESFATINSGAYGLTVSTGGTYSLVGKTIEGGANIIDATSSDDTTIIGADTADGAQPSSDFTASGAGNDTLKAGEGAGDALSADGSGNDTLSAGDGEQDGLSASGDGNDTLTAGNGNFDSLSATGTGTDTLTSGDGENDRLTGSNGTDTLTAGNGNDDNIAVITGGNVLNMGDGTGDTLSAAGGGNILNGGSGGDTFTVYDNDNQVTGGSGDDTFVLAGSSAEGSDPTIDLTGTTIDGGAGFNTLISNYLSLDISGADVENIQEITTEYPDLGLSLTLNAGEMTSLTSLVGVSTLDAEAAGTYSIAGLTTTTVTMNDLSSTGGVTLIGNDASGETLVASQSNDTAIAGMGSGDSIQAVGVNGTATAYGTNASLTVDLSGIANSYGSNGEVALEGSNDTANIYGSNAGVFVEGSGDVTNVFGTGAVVTISYGNANVNILGSNATVFDNGNGGNTFTVGGAAAANNATIYSSELTRGGDSYIFVSNFGQDVIDVRNSGETTGEVYFTSGVTDQNLWFSKVNGYDLRIDLMGTTETVTISGWFVGAQVQSIILSNGTQLSDAQVAGLVSAMATYASANPTFDPSTATSIPADSTLQSAVATAWASSVTITDSAANVAIELNTLQTLATNGQLAAITLTNSGTPTLAITATQLANDSTALSDISGSYGLAVSGVLAANAASVAAQSDVTSISVSDTATGVAADIDALQALSTKLTSITLADTGTPVLDIAAAQLTNDAATLAKISGSYDLSVSNVLAANASTVAANASVTSITVADTAANVTSNLAELETLVASGELQLITLTDPGVPTVVITAAQLSADSGALAAMSGTLGEAVVIDSTGSTSLAGAAPSVYLGDNTLWIGDSAAASLTVNDGNSLQAGEIDIGEGLTGSGTITVDGDGSFLGGTTLAVGGTAGASGGAGQVTVSGGAVVAVADLQVWGDGLVTLAGGSLETDPVTVSGGTISGNGTVSGDITNGGEIIASGGTLELLNAIAGTGTLIIASGATLRLDGAVGSGITVAFESGGTGTLELADPGDMRGTIIGEVSGDAVTDVACFAAGTRIRTANGEVSVEALMAGDSVHTVMGGPAPVRWIGHRRIDCRRHPKPEAVWPVRIAAGAFGPDLPHRDLWLSPDHAVYAQDVLIPIKHLINGTSIAQVPVDEVTYYHVELPEHDVLLAEGLPAESYLDIDDKSNFSNGGQGMRLFPDFSSHPVDISMLWEAKSCAPLVVYGPEYDSARRQVSLQAAALTPQSAAA
jgi:hypothetical protein